MLIIGLAAAAAASVAFNVGIVLQALDAREAPADEGLRLSLLARLLRRKRWVAGFLLGGVGFGWRVCPRCRSWLTFFVVVSLRVV